MIISYKEVPPRTVNVDCICHNKILLFININRFNPADLHDERGVTDTAAVLSHHIGSIDIESAGLLVESGEVLSTGDAV